MMPTVTHTGIEEACLHTRSACKPPKPSIPIVCALRVETAKNLHLKQMIWLIIEQKKNKNKKKILCMYVAGSCELFKTHKKCIWIWKE